VKGVVTQNTTSSRSVRRSGREEHSKREQRDRGRAAEQRVLCAVQAAISTTSGLL